jgi:hypothetical protein
VSPEYEKLYVGCGRQWVYVVRDRVGIAEPARPQQIPTAIVATTVTCSGVFSYEGPGPAALMDACGRKARDIAVGSNDLSTLSPGVYVLVAGRGAAPRKVVKLR